MEHKGSSKQVTPRTLSVVSLLIPLIIGGLLLFTMTACEQDSKLTIPDNAVKPAAPSKLTVWAYPSDSTVLTWVDNSINEDSFYVEESINNHYNFKRIATLAPNLTKLVLSYRPNANEFHFYRIQAKNQAGNSEYSNWASTRYMLAYTAQTTRGIQVANVTDPSNPVFFDSLSILNGDVKSLFVEGKTLYVTVKIGDIVYIRFYDITNPKEPILAGQISDLKYGSDVFTTANRMYVAEEELGVAVYPKATIGMVTRIGYVVGEAKAYGSAVVGNHIFIADGNRGLQILNIADELNPQLVARYLSTSMVMDVIVEDNIAYLADGPEGVVAVNVSDPANPTYISRYNTPGYATKLSFYNGRIYVSDKEGGIWILKLDSNNDLKASLNYDTPGKAVGVFVNSTDFYVADDNAGMHILRNTDSMLERLSTYTTRGSSIKAVHVIDYR